MTREFIEQLDVVEPNCYETDREERWYKLGLVNGLKIADEQPNLENLWHDAREEPTAYNWEILCEDDSEMRWVANHFDAYGNWDWFVSDESLVRWAYIDDLLPKGGEK